MQDLILKVERNEYKDKQGNDRVAYNYYVEVEGGLITVKVQLRPADYTGKEVLDAVLGKTI